MTEAQLAAVAFNTARNEALEELTGLVGRVQACAALGVSRATYYRRHRRSPAPARPRRERRRYARALTSEEEIRVLDVLHTPEFADMAPAEIYAVLLDRGVYLCSESTMYRLLRRHGEVCERRRQAVHPPAQNVARMMAGLGVTKSHSRPKASNDNPYSESQYKTLKKQMPQVQPRLQGRRRQRNEP